MRLFNYICRRLLQMIPVIIIVTILIFMLVRMIPGDPALTMLGDIATKEQIEAYRVKIGYYEPIWKQYLIWANDLIHLDLGDSLRFHIPVMQMIETKMPVTMALTAAIMLYVIVIGLPLGFWAGIKHDKAPDQVIRVFAMIGIAAPVFWVGLMLMLVFGVKLGWLPVTGWGTTAAQHIKSLILPGFTQAFAVIGVIIRCLRNNVVDISKSSYVTFAMSKGLSKGRIYWRYILRNALIPTTTVLSVWLAALLGGAVVVENVFTLPGMGQMVVDGILGRDYAVVQGVVLMFVFIVLIINLLTDIVYSLLDPRIVLD